MMDIFKKQKQFVDSMESIIAEQMESTFAMFGFVVKDFIINKQLFREGIDGDGNRLPGYKRTTIRMKIRKGDPVDRVTLRDENEFHPSIQIDAFRDRFEVSSDVDHAKWIIKRYGSNVLKLTRENITEFLTNYFIPNLKSNIDVRFAK